MSRGSDSTENFRARPLPKGQEDLIEWRKERGVTHTEDPLIIESAKIIEDGGIVIIEERETDGASLAQAATMDVRKTLEYRGVEIQQKKLSPKEAEEIREYPEDGFVPRYALRKKKKEEEE